MAIVTFNGISFNADWAATKTEAEFVSHEAHHNLTEAQLKEAHAICKKAVEPPKETGKNK
jgi:hypothetical protein